MFERLEKLYDRSTGGAKIAADPNNPLDPFWPRSDDAAGVDIAIEWFDWAKTQGRQALFFLVGGPGGGKSHVSAHLVSSLREINPKKTGLARRTHLYEFGGHDLLLVNDATISERGAEASSLGLEIQQCLATKRSLVACVNRGILIEELAGQIGADTNAAALLNWISNGTQRDQESCIQTLAQSDYIKFGAITKSSGEIVEICVSYVDACSLFEKSPKPKIYPENSSASRFELPEYRISKFAKRRGLEPSEMPGADLIVKAIDAILQDDKQFPENILHNPVAANLQNLSQKALVNSLSTLMRAAEISTGQRFTYREIWGAIARCVIGDLSVTTNSSNLQAELFSLQPEGENVRDNFIALQRLADLRYHQAIFAATGGLTVGAQFQTNPVTKLMAAVDPIRDSQPGYFAADDEGSGWVTPLLDAFSSSFLAGSPLNSIILEVRDNPDDLFISATTDFDFSLDAAFTKLIADPNLRDLERNNAVRWYATYLSRLYAVANGISAFREQIATWVQIWTTAPIMPRELDQQFLSMLRPRRAGSEDDSSYIPLFDSRTISITSRIAAPKLAARLSDLKTSTRRAGDSIILGLSEQGIEVSEILLDFSLLRDALVCTADDVGVSDVSSVNAPRLERLRAARLTPEMLQRRAPLSILFGTSVTEVVVSDG